MCRRCIHRSSRVDFAVKVSNSLSYTQYGGVKFIKNFLKIFSLVPTAGVLYLSENLVKSQERIRIKSDSVELKPKLSTSRSLEDHNECTLEHRRRRAASHPAHHLAAAGLTSLATSISWRRWLAGLRRIWLKTRFTVACCSIKRATVRSRWPRQGHFR